VKAISAWIALFVLALGCVANEYNEVARIRDAHARCVADRGASDGECDALEQRKLEEERRYHDSARRAWGCDPAQEQCPTPR